MLDDAYASADHVCLLAEDHKYPYVVGFLPASDTSNLHGAIGPFGTQSNIMQLGTRMEHIEAKHGYRERR